MGRNQSKLFFERRYWRNDAATVLAGVDEAGRGTIAGPVFAGAVSIDRPLAERLLRGELSGLDDSKKLTEKQRDKFYDILLATPGVRVGVGICSAEEIDRYNILCATHMAMRRALENLPEPATFALVDGLPVRGLPVPSEAIVSGDAKSFLIAAASVVAKVLRDREMERLDALWPVYGFAVNKGYGTTAHMQALFRHGSCPEHRHTFRPVRDVDECLPGLFDE